MSTRKHLLCTALMISVLIVAGCGSSGGGGGTPPATTVSGTASSAGGPLDEYVQITFTPSGGGTPTTLFAAADGTYNQTLSAGTYDVVAMRPGYADFTQAGFAVTADQDNPLNLLLVALAANVYIGTDNCGVCHTAIHDTFSRNGHPYKLNKVDGVAPTYPFTSLAGVEARITDEDGVTDNSLGTPSGWSQITYVIGGFFWKARFCDGAGYIVTGSEVQYNYETDEMVAYEDGVVDKPFNCGNCHTTGWRHYDATLNPSRQDTLAGMDGTFAFPGIQCEACHGAGSEHAQTELMADITRIATPRTEAQLTGPTAGFGLPVACGECHTRDGEADYDTYVSAFNLARDGAVLPRVPMGGRIAASGGLVKHHEQYDEAFGIDPDTLLTTRNAGFLANHANCNTCHDPHTTTVYRDSSGDTAGVDDSNAACLACHTTKTSNTWNTFGMTGLDCIDCHMPAMAKSAVAHAAVGTGPITGDVTSHIFTINLNDTAPQFTGSFAYPYITKAWACLTCHNGVNASDRSAQDFTAFEFHGD